MSDPKGRELPDFTKTLFLVGAGISLDTPSCIPPARPITRLFCDWIAAGDEELAAALLERCAPRHDHNPFDFIRFESLIGAIDRITPGIVQQLRGLERAGTPNAHHLFLAAAIARGARVITTNFDTRLEEAAQWQEHDPGLMVLSDRRRVPRESHRLIKLHGSFPENGRRRSLPRATLNRIGEIGLGFDHYPGFRDWFAEATAGATLYVLGYSASDSFDVVPLLEGQCRAARVEWFDFDADAGRLSAHEVRRGDPAPLPERHGRDFVAMTLSRLKGLHPETTVIRARGASLGHYLARRFDPLYREERVTLERALRRSDPLGLERALADNLAALEGALKANPLSDEQRELILERLFDDGMFGEGMTRAEDEHQPELPYQPTPPEPPEPATEEVREAQQRFSEALDAGRIEEAFRHAERWFDLGGTGDNAELQLMLADSEFEQSMIRDDRAGMARARAKARRWARDSGVLWGLMMALRMEALEIQRGYRGTAPPAELSDPLHRRRAIEQAHAFAYYAFRTGRADWFVPAVWITGALQETLFLSREAIALHRRLLLWLPEEAHPSRGVTLANLVTFALMAKDRPLARRFLKRLEAIAPEAWPLAEPFALVSRAEIDKTAGRLDTALEGLARAEAIIQRDFP
ncbi:SIR2 family protein, partial [Endothiovibrio diazotrophicus]